MEESASTRVVDVTQQAARWRRLRLRRRVLLLVAPLVCWYAAVVSYTVVGRHLPNAAALVLMVGVAACALGLLVVAARSRHDRSIVVGWRAIELAVRRRRGMALLLILVPVCVCMFLFVGLLVGAELALVMGGLFLPLWLVVAPLWPWLSRLWKSPAAGAGRTTRLPWSSPPPRSIRGVNRARSRVLRQWYRRSLRPQAREQEIRWEPTGCPLLSRYPSAGAMRSHDVRWDASAHQADGSRPRQGLTQPARRSHEGPRAVSYEHGDRWPGDASETPRPGTRRRADPGGPLDAATRAFMEPLLGPRLRPRPGPHRRPRGRRHRGDRRAGVHHRPRPRVRAQPVRTRQRQGTTPARPRTGTRRPAARCAWGPGAP
jgi:hypothetical protein